MINQHLFILGYPRQTRENIEILRKNNELDSGALERSYRYFVKSLYLWWIMASILAMAVTFIETEVSVFWAIVLLTFVFVGIPIFQFRGFIQDYADVFIEGKMTVGQVASYYKYTAFGAGSRHWGIRYTYKIQEKPYKIGHTGVPIHFWKKAYEEGAVIDVYYLEANPEKSVPDIPGLNRFFDFKRRQP